MSLTPEMLADLRFVAVHPTKSLKSVILEVPVVRIVRLWDMGLVTVGELALPVEATWEERRLKYVTITADGEDVRASA